MKRGSLLLAWDEEYKGSRCKCANCHKHILQDTRFWGSIPKNPRGKSLCKNCYSDSVKRIIDKDDFAEVHKTFEKTSNNRKEVIKPYDIKVVADKHDKIYFLLSAFEMLEPKKENGDMREFVLKGNKNNRISSTLSEVFEHTDYKVYIRSKSKWQEIPNYQTYREQVEAVLGTVIK